MEGSRSVGKKTLFALLCAISTVLFAWKLPLLPLSRSQEIVKIPKEAKTARAVTEILTQRQVLRYPRLFLALAQIAGWDKKFQRGSYIFRRPEAWPVLIRKLTRGERFTVKVAIPEGWRIEQIAQRLNEASIVNGRDFLYLAKIQNLEGRLYPTTYFFEPNSPPQEIIDQMTEQFERVWREHFEGKPAPMKFTKREIITLASIVERETTLTQEKPLIAGIYINRLKKGWRLEADPTVQYALGAWKSRVLYKDLDIKSAFNTYRRWGLPPAPIASPGMDSLAAVIKPAETEFMYFMASGTGGHIFFRTLEDHNHYKRLQKKEKKKKIEN